MLTRSGTVGALGRVGVLECFFILAIPNTFIDNNANELGNLDPKQ
jgi:hypothetical protein